MQAQELLLYTLLASRQTFLSHEKSVFKSCNRPSQALEQEMQTTQQLGMNDIYVHRPVMMVT
jgi:hypothetical protein